MLTDLLLTKKVKIKVATELTLIGRTYTEYPLTPNLITFGETLVIKIIIAILIASMEYVKTTLTPPT